MKKGESPERAARRELREETGYELHEMEHFVTRKYRHMDGRWITANIFIAVYDGRQKIECYEGQEMRFINSPDIKKINIYPGHKKLFQEVLKAISSGS